jgi:hypothetical protein
MDATQNRDSDTVCISGEYFKLATSPAPTSKLVQRAKCDILCDIAPKDFGKGIATVANLITVAYDASILLEQANVTTAVQDIG